MTLREVIEQLETCEGYMLAVSFKNGEKLDIHLLTEKFNLLDLLPSSDKIRDMIIAELQSVTINPTPTVVPVVADGVN